MRSFSGRLNVAPPACAARDDRDLVQRVGVLEQAPAAPRAPPRGRRRACSRPPRARGSSWRAPELHLVAGLLEVLVLDEVLVVQRRADRGLVDDRRQVGAAEHRRAAGDPLEVDVGPSLTFLAWTLRISRRPLTSGSGTVICRSKRPGGQRGVEHVGPVGRGDDDDAVARVEAVHLDEDGVERLLALVVPALAEPAAAPATDRVDLVEEDDAGRRVLGLLEQVAHAARADADEHLDEVRARDREERHVGLARRSPWRAASCRSPGWPTSSTPRGIRPPSRVNFLGFLRNSMISVTSSFASSMPATSLKVTPVISLVSVRCRRLAEVAEHAPAAAGVAGGTPRAAKD
jgi:hypothetical protein